MADVSYIINCLQQNGIVFHSLLEGKPVSFQQWRPAENKWNLLEIVCHLLDEERFDFRARIQHTLETPEKEMPAIDPVGWVTQKKYNDQDYNKTLNHFLGERNNSIRYLNDQQHVNWQTIHHHPRLGALSAEKFLCNWLAHDYLHIRQINRYQYLFFREISGIDLSYAGDW